MAGTEDEMASRTSPSGHFSHLNSPTASLYTPELPASRSSRHGPWSILVTPPSRQHAKSSFFSADRGPFSCAALSPDP